MKGLVPRHAVKLVRRIFANFGYTISPQPQGIGGNAFADMATLLKADRPVIFDVGANTGQSIENFRLWFQNAEIHSFEPSPATFQILQRNVESDGRIRPWNYALGAHKAEAEFLENTISECSSFLPLGESGWGSVASKINVPVHTVDDFCAEHGIEKINILKTDTQGYELEVFKGADRMFRRGAIDLVFCEMAIAEQYAGAPSFGQLYDFLVSQDFRLVSFYSIFYEKGLAAWTDGLFIHRSRLIPGSNGAEKGTGDHWNGKTG
jgi:FkbM family methyltransferase